MPKLALPFALAVLVMLGGCWGKIFRRHDLDNATFTPVATRLACVTTFEGKTATCLPLVAATPEAVTAMRDSCMVDPSQTIAGACPAKDLAGCCTVTGDDGAPHETCYYDPTLMNATPDKCKTSGGTWSAHP
jgi:hypothetical protein